MPFDRPKFEELMDDIKSGIADCIVVMDLSRFGRNYIETGNYLERVFPFLGVRFVAITDCFDTLNAERNEDGYIVPLKNLINAIYAKDISKKSGSALTAKRKNGDFIGTWASYGYLKDPNNKYAILVDHEVAPIVQDIFHWRCENISIQMIVRKLTALGIPSPSQYRYAKGIIKDERLAQSPWRAQTVKTMLQNEVYLGHMVQGRKHESLFEGQKQKAVPKEDWIIVRNTHEAIIDQALFDSVQNILQESHARYASRLGKFSEANETENFLKGLIYCGDCGTLLTRYKNVRVNKHKEPKYHIWYSYICPHHAANLTQCSFTSISEKMVLSAVFTTIQMQINCVINMKQLLIDLQKKPEFKHKKAKHQEKREKLLQKLSDTMKYRKGLFESYYAKTISEKDYLFLSDTYEKDADELNRMLTELAGSEDSFYQKCSQINPLVAVFEQFADEKTLSREMVLALVERIVITPNQELLITLKYHDEYCDMCKMLEEQAVSACV